METLYYVLIGISILAIALLITILFIQIKPRYTNSNISKGFRPSGYFNEHLKSIHSQISEILNNQKELHNNIEQIKKTLHNLNDKILQKENVKEQLKINYNENSYNTFAKNEDLKVQNENQRIYVRYVDRPNLNVQFIRDDVPDYFYISKKDQVWRLYILEKILEKSPSQEYEHLLTKFFEIDKIQNPTKYEMIEGAEINWDETRGEGYLKSMGKIKQV